MVHKKLFIRFRKTGDLRLISHRDLARAFERMFRRANLPLAMSQGFHPHARISFPSALALGIQGENEVVVALLDDDIDEQTVRDQFAAHAPSGLEITQVQVVDPSHPKPQVESMTYAIDVPHERVSAVRQRIDDLLTRDHVTIQREGRAEPVDLQAALCGLELIDQRLVFKLRATGQAQARPRDVLALVGLDDLEQLGVLLIRSDVQLTENA